MNKVIPTDKELAEKKHCKVCGELKLLISFNRHPTMKDGHLNTCKSCQKNRKKKQTSDYFFEEDAFVFD